MKLKVLKCTRILQRLKNIDSFYHEMLPSRDEKNGAEDI